MLVENKTFPSDSYANPFLMASFALNKFFVKESNIPRACSPTASLFPSGALIIDIFLDFAYRISIFSVPDPILAIKSRFFALSINEGKTKSGL